MSITILHDPFFAASRDFIATLGVTIPEGDDVTVAVGADTVRIISDHASAVALCPAFPGYPTAFVNINGIQRILFNPANLNDILQWAENEQTIISKEHVLAELNTLDSVLSRESEDIVSAAGLYDSLPSIMQQRITRKSELRAKLKELS